MKPPPPRTGDTEIYADQPKVRGSGPVRIDVHDPDQVWDLANRLRVAPPRELMAVTIDELRAVAALAAACGPAAAQATILVERFDQGASIAALKQQIAALAAVTRPLMERLK